MFGEEIQTRYIEGLGLLADHHKPLSPVAIEALGRLFDKRREYELPEHKEKRVYFVLEQASIALCAGRHEDLRDWIAKTPEASDVPEPENWPQRVLFGVFECWTILLAGGIRGRVFEIGAALRAAQIQQEKNTFARGTGQENRVTALRLISLYHLLKITELLAESSVEKTDFHFEKSIKAASAAGDSGLEMTVRWLWAASGALNPVSQ